MTRTAGKKKKPRVKEIDGVLWLLDDNGNRVKKVKKKVKPGEVDASNHSMSRNSSGHTKRSNVKEIDGVLYQLDENGNPVKKLRKKGAPRQPSPTERRRRAASQGPVAGRRRPRERIESGVPRFRSNSAGKYKQKPGEYIDGKGRKVVIDNDGNKTVYDKNGRKLRPKRKPIPVEPIPVEPIQMSSKKPEFYDRRQDLMKSSIYESGRFDALWSSQSPMPRAQGSKIATLPSFQESCSNISIGPADLVTKDSAAKIIDGDSGPATPNPNDSSRLRRYSMQEKSNEQIEELSNKVTEYGVENRDLKTQLMAAEEKVRTLTQQNQKEKSKNIKSTTEMLQLKADYQQASDEKRNLNLQLKNVEARYKEKEEALDKLESMPANRRINMPVNASGGSSDHLVQQITDLMAENDVLLDKLELAKASSGHDAKKLDGQILFLNEELRKTREENDLLFRGEAEKDPLMGRLFKQKKDLEEQIKQEKEKTFIRIDSMQETIDTLEKSNAALKKDLEKITLEVKDDDDDDVRRAKEMAQAVANRGTNGNARQVKRRQTKAQNQADRRGSGFWGFRDTNDRAI